MSDLLNTASAWLEGKRRAYMATAMVYRRADASCSVSATRAKTLFNQTEDHSFVQTDEGADFIIGVDELVLNSVQTIPQPGDYLVDPLRGTFEVMSPTPGRQCYEMDEQGNRYRIHARKMANA
jgi:hypothetical protein